MKFKIPAAIAAGVLGMTALASIASADLIIGPRPQATVITVSGQDAIDLWEQLEATYTEVMPEVWQKTWQASSNKLNISCTWTLNSQSCTITKTN